MCAKPFSQTKNKGKLFLIGKSSGPLLARMPLNVFVSGYIVSTVAPSVPAASAISAPLILPLLLLGGFYVKNT